MKKSIIVINPKAGKGRSFKALPGMIRQLETRGYTALVYQTTQRNDLEGIYNFAEQNQDAELLVCMGGDGTLNDLVNALPEDYPTPILCMPGGSGNDFAMWLHGQNDTETILNSIHPDRIKRVRTCTCNDRKFINGLGIGFDGWVAMKANTGRNLLPPKLKYHMAIFSGLFTYRSFYTNLGLSLIIAVANAPTYGGGFMIAPEADPTDNLLDLWQIRPIKTHERPFYLSLIKKGGHLNRPGPYIHKKTESIHIQCYKPLPAHLDGEYFYSDVFDVKVNADGLNFYTSV